MYFFRIFEQTIMSLVPLASKTFRSFTGVSSLLTFSVPEEGWVILHHLSGIQVEEVPLVTPLCILHNPVAFFQLTICLAAIS